MRILLDTHILIWALYDTSRLKDELKELIKDEANEICYSVVTLWEIEIKHLKHPEDFEFTSSDIHYDAHAAGYYSIDLDPLHIYALGSLEDEGKSCHKDPFDRILIAQAKSEGMLFVTHDKRLLAYNEPCVKYF